jgi:hypothetical protein
MASKLIKRNRKTSSRREAADTFDRARQSTLGTEEREYRSSRSRARSQESDIAPAGSKQRKKDVKRLVRSVTG